MLLLIRLTLTNPRGKSLHICNGQIITSPQMFVSSFLCVFVWRLLRLWKTISDSRFFTWTGAVSVCFWVFVANMGGRPPLCLKGTLCMMLAQA